MSAKTTSQIIYIIAVLTTMAVCSESDALLRVSYNIAALTFAMVGTGMTVLATREKS